MRAYMVANDGKRFVDWYSRREGKATVLRAVRRKISEMLENLGHIDKRGF